MIDAVLEPYLGTTPDEPDQVVEDEEEKIVFRTASVGGPPRKIKKTANKISGVEFTLDGSGVVSVLESEDINLKDPKANVQLVESSVCSGEPAAGGSAEITINRYRIPKADEVEKEAPEKLLRRLRLRPLRMELWCLRDLHQESHLPRQKRWLNLNRQRSLR